MSWGVCRAKEMWNVCVSPHPCPPLSNYTDPRNPCNGPPSQVCSSKSRLHASCVLPMPKGQLFEGDRWLLDGAGHVHTCEAPGAIDQSQRSEEEEDTQGPPLLLSSEAHSIRGRTNHCLTFLYIPGTGLQLLSAILKGRGVTLSTLCSSIHSLSQYLPQYAVNTQYVCWMS